MCRRLPLRCLLARAQVAPGSSMSALKPYAVPFISGGLTVALIKYAGNALPAPFAAFIGAFPLGMISSPMIAAENK